MEKRTRAVTPRFICNDTCTSGSALPTLEGVLPAEVLSAGTLVLFGAAALNGILGC